MQGGVRLEVSVVLRHLEFDDLRVGGHCHAAVLSLYLLTTFWDMKGVVHMEFLKQGHTADSEKYISTLRTLKARPRRVSSGRDINNLFVKIAS